MKEAAGVDWQFGKLRTESLPYTDSSSESGYPLLETIQVSQLFLALLMQTLARGSKRDFCSL
jgi:hypothetical protein